MALSDYGSSKDLFTKPQGGLYKVIAKYGQIFIDGLKKKLEENDSIASKKLYQSVRFKIRILGDIFVFEVRMEDYWRYVENGRQGGKQPPIEDIIKWTLQKGFTIPGRTAEQKRRNRRSLAFLIARKIASRGTKKRPFQKKTLNTRFINDFTRELSAAAGKEIRIEVRNMMEDFK